jgi:hypothetical protein
MVFDRFKYHRPKKGLFLSTFQSAKDIIRYQKKLKRRSAIEPTIGHVKSDNRMDRNYLKGVAGDMMNAILAATGYNMRKLIAAFLYALLEMAKYLRQTIFTCPNLL